MSTKRDRKAELNRGTSTPEHSADIHSRDGKTEIAPAWLRPQPPRKRPVLLALAAIAWVAWISFIVVAAIRG